MRAAEFIRAIRDGAPAVEQLQPGDIAKFVAGLVDGTVSDDQAGAFLMAVYLKGLPTDLTAALTLAMRDSGDVIRFDPVAAGQPLRVDKHSTGGVGDKISLPLAPLVAACGVPVPMMSGRGLGHTGGTLDKLESIPGFNVNLDAATFVRQVDELGVAMMGQTPRVVPADRKLYAIRDVTATVESVPLITASILSKKLAEGIDGLVLDVKVGRGAFMRTMEEAQALAESLVRVGKAAGLKVRALLTRMDAPLGTTIGNALEVRESIEILRHAGPADTTELTLRLAGEMLLLSGGYQSLDEAVMRARRALASGDGLAKFAALVAAQGGDPRVVEAPLEVLPQAAEVQDVCACQAGWVDAVDSYMLGLEASRLGAGRAKTTDRVDPSVGLEVLKRPGDAVAAGEPVARVHASGTPDAAALQRVREAFVIAASSPAGQQGDASVSATATADSSLVLAVL